MARKRHGGLGRGLDALIPQARPQRSVPQEEREKDPQQSGPQQSDPQRSGPQEEKEKNPQEGKGLQTVENGNPGAGPEHGSDAAKKNAGAGAPESIRDFRDAEGEKSLLQGGSAAQDQPAPEREMQDPKTQESGIFTDQTIEKRPEDSGGVRMLRLSQVDPNRGQPREIFEDESLGELAESIRQFGVLQPILVQKRGARYEIIAGERRWRASRKAGLKEIPAIVREYSDQETLELSLIENIQREDLNPIEEAKAFRRLLDEFGLRQEDLAARVSKSRTAITNAVRLLRLDERVQEMLIQNQISMGHARALLSFEIPDEQFLAAQETAEKHLSVREVEKLVKKRLAAKETKSGAKKKKEKEKDPALELAYRSIEERLKQSLGTKAAIRSAGDGSGKIEIEFYSHDDLEKIVDLLT